MNVKELYDYAVKTGRKNAQIIINYECNDNWYDYNDPIQKSEVELCGDKVIIHICNY